MASALQLSTFDAAAVLIVLAAVLAYLNQRFLKLPPSIGLTVMGALASVLVVGIDRLVPSSRLAHDVVGFLDHIDFRDALLNGMLSFLLFAGALHVSWAEMRRGRWAIILLSTIGVVLSTVIVGFGLAFLCDALNRNVPLSWCLVFGALISPTDPVAVMAVLKRTAVPPTLQATVAAESLFNDGVGVVVFAIILQTALGQQAFAWPNAARLFAIEAGGGIALGLITGGIAFRAMQTIDDHGVEVMISLAVVMGGYALANRLHVSGPVAMAVAGLVIGNRGVALAMSDTTKDYMLTFWSLVDDILNALLFLLIGLEVVTIPADPRLILLGVAAIPLVLLARAGSVLVPLLALRPVLDLGRLAPATLIWGGLRGGISVALALGLPPGPARDAVLAATYVVVLFSVIVQGSSIERVIAARGRPAAG